MAVFGPKHVSHRLVLFHFGVVMSFKVPKIVVNKKADFMDHVKAFEVFLGEGKKREKIEGKSFEELLDLSLQLLDTCPAEKLFALVPRSTEQEIAGSIIIDTILQHRFVGQNISFYYKILLMSMRFWDDKTLDSYLEKLEQEVNLTHDEKDSALTQTYKEVITAFIDQKNKRVSPPLSDVSVKIAVCVSGQMRGYENAFETWENLGFEGHQVDYYVHTWKEVGRRIPDRPQHASRMFGGNFLEAYKTVLVEKGYSYFQQNYPTLCFYASKVSQVSEEQLKAFYNTTHVIVEDESEERFHSMSNQEKMLYKIYECNELLKSSGNHYDVVIRMRPDKLFDKQKAALDWVGISKFSEEYKVLFTVAHVVWFQQGGLAMSDQFAIASPTVFNTYSAAYTKCEKNDNNIVGFRVLADQLISNGLRIRRLLGVKPLDFSDLPCLKDEEVYNLLVADIQGRELDTDVFLLNALNYIKA